MGIVAELLSARDYQPILRTLRLLFGEGNRESLASFLPKVPAPTWLRLYKSALGNEFLSQPQCAPSLVLLRKYLTNAGLLCTNGRAIHPGTAALWRRTSETVVPPNLLRQR